MLVYMCGISEQMKTWSVEARNVRWTQTVSLSLQKRNGIGTKKAESDARSVRTDE
jgi:hypothetical protein